MRLGLWPCEGLRPTPVAGTLGCAPVQLTNHISLFISVESGGGYKIYHSPSVNPSLPASLRGWLASLYIVPCYNTVILRPILRDPDKQ